MRLVRFELVGGFGKGAEDAQELAQLAEFHAELTKRQLASIEDEKTRQKKLQLEREKEDRRIKAWFRSRALSD